MFSIHLVDYSSRLGSKALCATYFPITMENRRSDLQVKREVRFCLRDCRSIARLQSFVACETKRLSCSVINFLSLCVFL